MSVLPMRGTAKKTKNEQKIVDKNVCEQSHARQVSIETVPLARQHITRCTAILMDC